MGDLGQRGLGLGDLGGLGPGDLGEGFLPFDIAPSLLRGPASDGSWRGLWAPPLQDGWGRSAIAHPGNWSLGRLTSLPCSPPGVLVCRFGRPKYGPFGPVGDGGGVISQSYQLGGDLTGFGVVGAQNR